MLRLIATLSTLILMSTTLLANEVIDELSDKAKYVSINIEIKELKDSGIILRDATNKLAATLNHASNNIDDLSPEQLKLINTLADKVDDIAIKLNQTVNDLPGVIKRAQAPSAELLGQSLDQVNKQTIEPITDTLELWIIITVVGLSILGIGFFIAFTYCAKHIGNMGVTIKQIADGYRVIPVEQYRDDFQNQKTST